MMGAFLSEAPGSLRLDVTLCTYNWTAMPLFDQLDHTDRRPKRQNEGGFDYMNASARPGIVAIRALLEEWFEQLPDAAKADIRERTSTTPYVCPIPREVNPPLQPRPAGL